MDEHTPAGDYAQFIAGLPAEHETDLAISEKAATAFFLARRAGWSVDDLVGDAHFAIRRGGERPVGLVIRRLEDLAKTRPVSRPEVATVTRIHRNRWAAVEGAWCPCGEQPPHKVPAALTPDQTRERSALLDRIVADDVDPDEAERLMAELIAAQRPTGGAPW